MSGIWTILAPVIAFLVAPFIGGLLRGIDRKLTARMQGRIGPPIVQPCYDVLKLFSKERIVVNKAQLIWVMGYLILVIAALCLLVAGNQDLLMIMLVLGFGAACLALGSLSVRSPYAQFGGMREILQILAYEPILLLSTVAIFAVVGTFRVNGIIEYGRPLLPHLPLAFIAVLLALTIKMRKSPFDISASEHAHQEIVRGVYTEYSGFSLALIELTHWYELVFIVGFIALFWAHPLWVGVLIALACWFVELIVDNMTARLTWALMLRVCLPVGMGLVLVNIAGGLVRLW
ncbi:MAG: NADH-quinone oxidoreductase subunit H [Chloroflexi bacterium]|nr:MAG: NADH-quinone oxidoreductase subunit H [Chloroflexota bacterium]